jgi:hypothetical protein
MTFFKSQDKAKGEGSGLPDLFVFALVADIAIYKLHQGGNKKVFINVASQKIDANNEYIPTALEVAQHKVSNKLIVCLAVQSTKLNKYEMYDHYVLVYEFDHKNDYSCEILVRQKAASPQITKILYRENCGLIMSCFFGYIELFDSIDF